MIYETGDIKEAIREYYEREIEDKNLVYKGRIDALHKWRDEDLERLSELERRAEAFDKVIRLAHDSSCAIDNDIIAVLMNIVRNYEESEAE